MIGARDRDLAGFEWLAHGVEHARFEFGKFVEKKHAMMGERDLAGLGAQSAADQRWHVGRMMRAAERALLGERTALELARDRSDHRHFEQLRRRERRQDGGEPRRQH